MKKTKNNAMEGLEWEMRPGGMLVQKRNLESQKNQNSITIIKVLVKFGHSYHEIHINSHSNFGELKKMLAGPTGLHPQDQKLIFRDKERDSMALLDVAGVRDGSRMVLVEDTMGQESMKAVSGVAMEVDKLVAKVTAMESVICRGGRVEEKDLLNLIEMLMSELLKLDGIIADGDVKLKRKMQVIRIQKHIEILDRLKVRNRATKGHHVGLIMNQSKRN